MFRKKRCPNCGRVIDKKWSFCAFCGVCLRGESLFEEMNKELERMRKFFVRSLLSFPPIKGGGIKITIHSGTGIKPKIEIRTSGEYRKLEPEIKRRLGIREVKEEKVVIPRVTEEPETKVYKLGRREVIEVKLPGVKEEDVDIRKLEQSLEIKAMKGKKAYFTVLPVRPNSRIVKKEMKKGLLRIELE